MNIVIMALYDRLGVGGWIWVKFKLNLTFRNFSEISKATSGWICSLSFPFFVRFPCIGLASEQQK